MPEPNRGRRAQALVAELFSEHGWRVHQEPNADHIYPDLLLRKGSLAYVAEIKSLREGRSDRAIPLLSQAILEAQAKSRAFPKARPLAIICVGRASRQLFSQVIDFSERYAPGIAIGLIAEEGGRLFVGDGLKELNAEADFDRKFPFSAAPPASNLFSDLNQWMLKVLLAPEIPEHLLNSPRGLYRNASLLAKAAGVSLMSAFRFLQQMQEEGFIEPAPYLKLVRRRELLDRWKSSVIRSSPEIKVSFLLSKSVPAQLQKIASAHEACLGYFAAAEALRLGHVSGVPPYIYVRQLPRSSRDRWKELMPASPGEPFDLVLKQPHAKESVFRGAVQVDGVAVSDVLQVWLDVSVHPSRGREQAELIWSKVLHRVIEK